MREVVIIGAGWSGLGIAKTYLQVVGPSADILILDSASTLGGVWAKERLYPDLRSNNLLGTYEFPDFPMVGFGVEKGQHIPGEVVHDYLEAASKHFGTFDKIRFNAKVKTAEYRGDDGWILMLDGGEKIECRKLVMATGLTSEPIIPAYKGMDMFGAPLFHVKELHDRTDEVLRLASAPDAKPVTILGGSKNAFDAVYLFASRGVKVDWVIRKSGYGPAWITPPFVTPFKLWAEALIVTRFFTWLSPCIWGDADGYGGARRFFHNTWFGRKFVNGFFWLMGNDAIDLTGLKKHEELKKLIPWQDVLWNASSFAILNYPTDFYELIKNGTVRIHIQDIDHLSPSTIHFADGTSIASSALVISNGWKPKPPIKFLPEGIDATLGLPHKASRPDELGPKADAEVLTKFPRLADQPINWTKNYKSMPLQDHELEDMNTPYRLHRLMVPPALAEKRSLVFSATISHDTVFVINIQALWATAYLTGKLDLDKKTPKERAACGQTLEEELEYDSLLTSRWMKWRYPASRTKLAHDFAFDAVPYLDLLLSDLGLNRWRKGGGVKEWFSPYTLADYKDVAKEWMAKTQ